MSYNIDTWKTKELRDLRIPLAALQPKEHYLDPPTLDTATNTLTFTGRAKGFELRGKVGYDAQSVEYIAVEHIESWGEASGTMHDYLKKILSQSTGVLIAVLVWEGGDAIERLIVKDGVVTEEDIEL